MFFVFVVGAMTCVVVQCFYCLGFSCVCSLPLDLVFVEENQMKTNNTNMEQIARTIPDLVFVL